MFSPVGDCTVVVWCQAMKLLIIVYISSLLGRIMSIEQNLSSYIPLAKCPHTSQELLESFACSNSDILRMAVASNPSLGGESLTGLLSDSSGMVRKRAASNPSLPKDICFTSPNVDKWICEGLSSNTTRNNTTYEFVFSWSSQQQILTGRTQLIPQILAANFNVNDRSLVNEIKRVGGAEAVEKICARKHINPELLLDLYHDRALLRKTPYIVRVFSYFQDLLSGNSVFRAPTKVEMAKFIEHINAIAMSRMNPQINHLDYKHLCELQDKFDVIGVMHELKFSGFIPSNLEVNGEHIDCIIRGLNLSLLALSGDYQRNTYSSSKVMGM